MAVTVASIARAAGVSRATVSLVLNKRGDQLRINRQTQERIRKIAEQLNYQPHPLARGLAGSRTRSISVLWSMGGAQHSGRAGHILREVVLGAQNRGYTVQLCDHLNDPKVIVHSLRAYRQWAIDGIIIELNPDLQDDPAILEACAAFPATVLILHRPGQGRFDQLIHQQRDAFAAVGRHFGRIGRRKPCFIFGSLGAVSTIKVQSFIKGCESSGIAKHDVAVHALPPARNQELGPLYRRVLDEAYPDGSAFDALLCSTDEGAAWATDWLREKGRRVPEDVAVAGVNDTELARVLHPPIASVARNDDELVGSVHRMLFNRLENAKAAPQSEEVAMKFVWRPSAGGEGDMSGR
jgi:LacI family transcriptional regulator